MGLEATLPSVPLRPALPEHLASLDEPSGAFAPPSPRNNGPASKLEIASPAATSPAAAPPKDNFDARFERVLATVRANRPHDDLDLIRAAWAFCQEQHEGQRRASGEPYVIHPLEVAQVLAELKMDATAIAAGLLHDAVEDTDVTTQEIARRFGEQVAHIVEGVTKLDKIKFANREDHQAENIRKMLLAMVTDVRVVIIKLADRLHNMRTLEHLHPEKQQRIAKETLDVYAPLAHRLGMGKLRGELEDLAFRYIDPFTYAKLSTEVEALRGEGEAFLDRIVGTIEAKLRDVNIHARVESRIKRLYSIQQKLNAHGIPVDQVYDLFAVRVITQTEQDCYAVLGLLHATWRPVPGRFKDFIAMPRPNLYQSLHTTLIAEGGHQFEVQIRTEDMHRVAEEGIAAHWKYKAADNVTAKDEQRLAWVRQLMEWQREMSDPNEFMSTLRIDLYPEEVYTFTPKGKVIVLPKDASPIDFAYAIHTEVGNATIGAKVNGRIVPLRTKLRNGDIVEITTQAGHAPSRDWLSFTKTSRARNKIKHWLNEHQRERAIEIGQQAARPRSPQVQDVAPEVRPADFDRVAREYGLHGEQELLAGIGFGKYSARQVLNKLEPGSTIDAKEPAHEPGSVGNTLAHMSDAVKRVFFGKGSDSLQVEGQDDLLVYRARCCNPIRGEEIIGYVTRGKGVAVHARSCPNVQNLLYEADRRIEVEWSGRWATPRTPPAPSPRPIPSSSPSSSTTAPACSRSLPPSSPTTAPTSASSKRRPAADGAVHVDFVIETVDLRHLTRLEQNSARSRASATSIASRRFSSAVLLIPHGKLHTVVVVLRHNFQRGQSLMSRICRVLCLTALAVTASTLSAQCKEPANKQWTRPSLDAKQQETVNCLVQLNTLPDGEWRIHAGDIPHGESPTLDDHSWPVAKVPSKAGKEAVWYRQRITIPKTLNGYDLTGSGICFQFIATANGPMPEIIYFNGRRVALGEDLEPIPLFDHAKPGQTILVAVKLLPTVDDKDLPRRTRCASASQPNRPNPHDIATEIVSAANLLPALAPNSLRRQGHSQQSHRADRSPRTRCSTAGSVRRLPPRSTDPPSAHSIPSSGKRTITSPATPTSMPLGSGPGPKPSTLSSAPSPAPCSS